VAEPCGWEPAVDCCSVWGDLPPSTQSSAAALAGFIVWALSGRQYGLCPRVLRPCAQPCGGSTYASAYRFASGYGGGEMYPAILASGEWINIACRCGDPCDCTTADSVVLPPQAYSVTAVNVDGVDMPNWSYRDHQRRLYRTDGNPWPLCQDMSKLDTEPGTWSVEILHGVPIPPGGNEAAGALACEIGKSCAGLPCILPDRVTSITREGVSMEFIDPQEFLDKGLVGIPAVDRWLRAVNPSALPMESYVWSPDVATPRWQ